MDAVADLVELDDEQEEEQLERAAAHWDWLGTLSPEARQRELGRYATPAGPPPADAFDSDPEPDLDCARLVAESFSLMRPRYDRDSAPLRRSAARIGAVGTGVRCAPRARAARRASGARRTRAPVGASDDGEPPRSSADVDPVARRREQTRARVAAHRERLKRPCERCGAAVPRLHDGLCWPCNQDEDQAAAKGRQLAADYRARLEAPIAETARLRRRVHRAAEIRHAIWAMLPSANGNRADLVEFEYRVTNALDKRWEEVREAETRDRRESTKLRGGA
jgi:hypothetical protein